MALSVFHRFSLLAYITEEYIDDPHRESDQFAPNEIDANTLVADYMDTAELGRKSIADDASITDDMKMDYAMLHSNIKENRWEAVAFVEQIVALCNRGST